MKVQRWNAFVFEFDSLLDLFFFLVCLLVWLILTLDFDDCYCCNSYKICDEICLLSKVCGILEFVTCLSALIICFFVIKLFVKNYKVSLFEWKELLWVNVVWCVLCITMRYECSKKLCISILRNNIWHSLFGSFDHVLLFFSLLYNFVHLTTRRASKSVHLWFCSYNCFHIIDSWFRYYYRHFIIILSSLSTVFLFVWFSLQKGTVWFYSSSTIITTHWCAFDFAQFCVRGQMVELFWCIS